MGKTLIRRLLQKQFDLGLRLLSIKTLSFWQAIIWNFWTLSVPSYQGQGWCMKKVQEFCPHLVAGSLSQFERLELTVWQTGSQYFLKIKPNYKTSSLDINKIFERKIVNIFRPISNCFNRCSGWSKEQSLLSTHNIFFGWEIWSFFGTHF